MYKSPIEITECFKCDQLIDQMAKEMVKQQDENIYRAIIKTGVNVDKEELIKALSYDRNQYNEGFEDGVKDFADTFKKHIRSFTGMFTDYGFMVNLEAVCHAVDFIKEKLVGEYIGN